MGKSRSRDGMQYEEYGINKTVRVDLDGNGSAYDSGDLWVTRNPDSKYSVRDGRGAKTVEVSMLSLDVQEELKNAIDKLIVAVENYTQTSRDGIPSSASSSDKQNIKNLAEQIKSSAFTR